MSKLFRMVLPILLVAFASAATVSATQATVMTVTMALLDGGSMDGADCGACDADESDAMTTPCDLACTSSQAVLSAVGGDFVPSPVAYRSAEATYGLLGRTGPPEPDPPQAVILS